MASVSPIHTAKHEGDEALLPCHGCDEAVAHARCGTHGHDLELSGDDGCWVVRIGFSEKLRCDSVCTACTYFRNKTEQLAG